MKDFIEVVDRSSGHPVKALIRLSSVAYLELEDPTNTGLFGVNLWDARIEISREDLDRILAALEQL